MTMMIHTTSAVAAHEGHLPLFFSTLITIDIVVSINQEVTCARTHIQTHTNVMHSPGLSPIHTRVGAGNDDNIIQ